MIGSVMVLLLLAESGGGETGQSIVPELVKPGAKFGQTFAADGIEAAGALRLHADKARFGQHLEVLRHCRATDGQSFGQSPHWQGTGEKRFENQTARRVGKGREGIYASHDLR